MTTADSPSAAGQIPLADLRKGMRGLVTAVVDDDTAQIGDTAGSTVARRLREIGPAEEVGRVGARSVDQHASPLAPPALDELAHAGIAAQ